MNQAEFDGEVYLNGVRIGSLVRGSLRIGKVAPALDPHVAVSVRRVLKDAPRFDPWAYRQQLSYVRPLPSWEI